MIKTRFTKTARSAVTTVTAIKAAKRVQRIDRPSLVDVVVNNPRSPFSVDYQWAQVPDESLGLEHSNAFFEIKPKPSLWKSIFKLVGLLSVFGAVYVGFVLALAGRIS